MSQTLSTPSPQRTAAASPIVPGFFVQQGLSIQERLQISFPPSLFMFQLLAPRIDARKWGELTQGNQPFIGLGFNGLQTGARTGGALQGDASWTVIVAVRNGDATDRSRYYGDRFEIGALTMAEVAAAVLHNYRTPTGTLNVHRLTNVVADDWGHDSVIVKIDLTVPVTLRLDNAILQPDGLGWFDVLANDWGWSSQDGSPANYESQWSNPNAQPTD